MENAADALRIGAWVLIFVMALSVCINAFGQAKTSMDAILAYNDREYYTSYINESEYKDGDTLRTQRKVGYLDIVPTIYRAYKDNYRITFDSSTGINSVFKKKSASGTEELVNYIDLEDEKISDIKVNITPAPENGLPITLKEYFIRRIIMGDDGKFGPTYKDKVRSKGRR